jgi:hypothetical protein
MCKKPDLTKISVTDKCHDLMRKTDIFLLILLEFSFVSRAGMVFTHIFITNRRELRNNPTLGQQSAAPQRITQKADPLSGLHLIIIAKRTGR